VQDVIEAMQSPLQILQHTAKADQVGDGRQKAVHEALKGHEHAQAQMPFDDPQPTDD
jgi:hypothetical protein